MLLFVFFSMIFWEKTDVQATEAEDTIVVDWEIKQYDVSKQELTVEFFIPEESGYLTYCNAEYGSDLYYKSQDERFQLAGEATESKVEIKVSVGVTLTDDLYKYFWFFVVDENRAEEYIVPVIKNALRPQDQNRCNFLQFAGVGVINNVGDILIKNRDVKIVGTDGAEAELEIAINNGDIIINRLEGNNRYWYQVYYNGEFVNQMCLENPEYLTLGDLVYEEGEYDIVYGVYGDRNSIPQIAKYQYTKPNFELPPVTEVEWCKEGVGIVRFKPIEHENLDRYILRVMYSYDGKKYYSLNWYYIRNTDAVDGYLTHDFSSSLSISNASYKVYVQAISNSIETVAHSAHVYADYVYDPNGLNVEKTLEEVLTELGFENLEEVTAESIANSCQGKSEEEKKQLVAVLKEGFSELEKNELQVAVQTDSNIRDTLAALESNLSDITVKVDSSTIENDFGIDFSKVSILGAKLNADEATREVTLSITNASQENQYMPDKYKKQVVLDITLDGVANADTELDIPVRIGIPVPADIDINKLVIHHMKADGTPEETFLPGYGGYEISEEGRTVYFTIKHFSKFIFSEGTDLEGLGEKLTGCSISLNGNIAVKFYMELDDELANSQSAKMVFTLPNGNVEEILVSSIEETWSNGRYCYIFPCEVSAKEMTSEIKAQIVDGEQKGTVYTYTVKEYADYILEHTDTYADVVPLVKAMLNYGAYSQKHFEYKESVLANAELTENDKALSGITADSLSRYATVLEADENVCTFETAYLSLKSETSVTVKVKLAEGAEDVKFYIDGKELSNADYTQSGDYYILQINNIKASALDNMYEFKVTATVGDATKEATLSYGALSYCYSVLTGEYDEKLKDAAKALYLFNKAAEEYVNKKNGG